MAVMKNDWIVQNSESGLKLSAYLKAKAGETISAKQIKRSLDAGLCYLNGKVERFGSRLVGKGDKVSFSIQQETSKDIVRSTGILYSDEDVIAYDKPAGVISTDPILLKAIEKQGNGEAVLLHRLDKDTTGVLLFARNPFAEKHLLEQFKTRKMEKRYLAVVRGIPKENQGRINKPLVKLASYEGQSLWGVADFEDGLKAVTDWSILKKSTKLQAALLSCSPLTGRTHQIRVHLSHLGFPIIGDKQYGKDVNMDYEPKRMLLHAESLSFKHPRTNKMVEIKSPIPKDFKQALVHFFGEDAYE